MTEKPMVLHVIFHTHWDREWYLPFETFRLRLVKVVERVVPALENGEIQQFVLDGQTAALEDYFDVCEVDMKERVLSLIKDGKLVIGPWYVLADEFLVSGEALLRNLEIGLAMSRQFGKPQQVGYLPDTFGHVRQMPQILKGFGIENAILWRGVKPPTSEFVWEAPDGSQVLTIFLPDGYYQPIIDHPDYKERLETFLKNVKPFASTSQLLLTNGGDHLMPQYANMAERLKEINQIEMKESHYDYEQYVEAVKAELPDTLEVFSGEMRSNEHFYLLPNVLSTRTYLKEQNQWVEDELLGYVEPLIALGNVNRSRYLEKTWKLFLENHPHDSICGCSIDDVHREMEARTLKLKQRLEALQEDTLNGLGVRDAAVSGCGKYGPFDDDSKFVVFNPHPHDYSGWVKGTVWLKGKQDFCIQGPDNEKIIPTIFKQWGG
jgi:alpha-mannosidase/mannosylglycerate hydrolase